MCVHVQHNICCVFDTEMNSWYERTHQLDSSKMMYIVFERGTFFSRWMRQLEASFDFGTHAKILENSISYRIVQCFENICAQFSSLFQKWEKSQKKYEK